MGGSSGFVGAFSSGAGDFSSGFTGAEGCSGTSGSSSSEEESSSDEEESDSSSDLGGGGRGTMIAWSRPGSLRLGRPAKSWVEARKRLEQYAQWYV